MRQRARREGALTARPSRPGAGRVGAETQLEPVSLPTPQPARPAPHASAPRTARGRRLLTQPCTPTSLRSLRRPPRPSAPSLRRRWPGGGGGCPRSSTGRGRVAFAHRAPSRVQVIWDPPHSSCKRNVFTVTRHIRQYTDAGSNGLPFPLGNSALAHRTRQNHKLTARRPRPEAP